MTSFRKEHDFLGALDVPADALYGIHTARAIGNFAISGRPVSTALIRGYAAVKLACAEVNHDLGYLSDDIYKPLAQACMDMIDGVLDGDVKVDALQGGAGTSTNMNINEVLANRALILAGHEAGSYDVIHPIEHVNMHQSTNDTYPAALRVAAIAGLRHLEDRIRSIQEAFQEKEREFADVVRVGRTELQDAVLTTMGRTMGAYAEAFNRDRWRIYKCEERLRVIGLGGTAIGTGLAAPRDYIFKITDALRKLTGIGFARSENLIDAIQNQDVIVECSGILSACASSMVKIAGDIRLLCSGPDAGFGEIEIPPLQAGSSIMPGKVNPVAPEAAVQAGLLAIGNHSIISSAVSMGNLELNAFMPLIAEKLLESIYVLAGATSLLDHKCIRGIKVRKDRCAAHVDCSTAALTALIPFIGYEAAAEAAAEAAEKGIPVLGLIKEKGLMSGEQIESAIAPESVLRLGTVQSLKDENE